MSLIGDKIGLLSLVLVELIVLP